MSARERTQSGAGAGVAGTGTGEPAGSWDGGTASNVIPGRLRNLPSRLLSQVAMYSDRLVTEGLAAADARKWHYAVLVTLHESGPASQAELSDRTGIYRSDLVALINELADRGFVERTPDPADRRRNVITMTEEGLGQLQRLDGLITTVQDELLAPLNGPERDELTRLLTRLLDHHTKQ